MAAFYSAPNEKFDFSNAQQMLEKATNSVQFLVGRFFALPSEPTEGGRMVHLPPAVTVLPREKPIPKPKPLTRWEKFAKEKGIAKKKKDLMVYDEQSKEWKPRFGYKRYGQEAEVASGKVEVAEFAFSAPHTRTRAEQEGERERRAAAHHRSGAGRRRLRESVGKEGAGAQGPHRQAEEAVRRPQRKSVRA